MFCIHIHGYECVCSAFIYIAIPADAYFLNGYVVNKYVLNGYVWKGYVLKGYVLKRYVLTGYVLNGYVWDDAYTPTIFKKNPATKRLPGKKNIKKHTDLTPNWPNFTCKVPCCTSGHATDGTAQVRPQQVKQSHANKGCFPAPMAVFSGFSGFVMPFCGRHQPDKNLRYI